MPQPQTQQQLIYRLLPELLNLGDAVDMQGTLAINQLTKGPMDIDLPNGVTYRISLSNTGDGILLDGSVSAEAITTCTRCLDETTLSLAGEVQAYYILEEQAEDRQVEDDSVVLVGRDSKVDLAEPILAGLFCEIPFTVLCKPDCAGLCPGCGENLNHSQCTCVQQDDPDHPFAALRNLVFESEDDSEPSHSDADGS